MTTFAQAVQTQEARTENGMKAFAGTGNACLDLFYKIGGMRGQDPTVIFSQALAENEDLALRIMQWTRDVRGGAGERELFRKMLKHLEVFYPKLLSEVMPKIPEIGRYDDLLIFTEKNAKYQAFKILGDALRADDALVAKWLPRENKKTRAWVNEFCQFFGVTPKFYRKTLVRLTKVVETQMCAKKWDDINFSHVPSRAAAIYKKAFLRNAPESYTDYIQKLADGQKDVKINAAAIFPHDVIKDLLQCYSSVSPEIIKVATSQWEALPNYVGNSSVLAMVDSSGSMFFRTISGSNRLYPGDIALSLGLYTADKNKGPFKDTFLTFETSPKLFHLKGNIADKCHAIETSSWGGSTNIVAAFDLILTTARQANVAQKDMPKTLLIMSDMQFNECANFDHTAMEAVESKYIAAGYKIPNIVFWNLAGKDTVPSRADKSNVALVSGFSPSILKTVLSSENFTPETIMLDTVMIDRYAL